MPICRLANVLLPLSAAHDPADLTCSRLCDAQPMWITSAGNLIHFPVAASLPDVFCSLARAIDMLFSCHQLCWKQRVLCADCAVLVRCI